jgi:hypothetical protein
MPDAAGPARGVRSRLVPLARKESEMLVKHLIATAAFAAVTATSTGPAFAAANTLVTCAPGDAAARAAVARIRWTPDQLQALAAAYQAKNPGWHAPASPGVRLPADVTWTSANLDRLANAYAALNPGWTRPDARA